VVVASLMSMEPFVVIVCVRFSGYPLCRQKRGLGCRGGYGRRFGRFELLGVKSGLEKTVEREIA